MSDKNVTAVDPVRPAFQVHVLNETGIDACGHVARLFNQLLVAIEDVALPGRELALATTKLEEACFYAKKAVASHPGHQK